MRNGSTRHKHFALNSLEANKIAKFERRCHEFHSDFVPLALETYGGTSEKFDKLLEKLSSKQPHPTISPTLFCLIISMKLNTVIRLASPV